MRFSIEKKGNIVIFVKFDRTVNHLATHNKILKKEIFFPNFAFSDGTVPISNKITLLSSVTNLQNIITHLKKYIESKFQ